MDSDFDWEYYVGTYNLPFNQEQALEHWKMQGSKLGYYPRDPYNINIDTQYYREKYKDLSSLSDSELRIHWYRHGIKEERIPNKSLENFNWRLYASLYNLEKEDIDTYEKALKDYSSSEVKRNTYLLDIKNLDNISAEDISKCTELMKELSNMQVHDAKVYLLRHGIIKEFIQHLKVREIFKKGDFAKKFMFLIKEHKILKTPLDISELEYFYLLPEFISQYRKLDELEYCLFRYLDCARSLPLPKSIQRRDEELVFVFDTWRPHVEFIIRNTIYTFKDRYNYYIITTNALKDFFDPILREISYINIILLKAKDIKLENIDFESLFDLSTLKVIYGNIIFVKYSICSSDAISPDAISPDAISPNETHSPKDQTMASEYTPIGNGIIFEDGLWERYTLKKQELRSLKLELFSMAQKLRIA